MLAYFIVLAKTLASCRILRLEIRGGTTCCVGVLEFTTFEYLEYARI